MLCVQGLVDLIKQVERSRVTLLDGKYQSQSHQRLLTSRQLLHLSHLALLPGEGHLRRTCIKLDHQTLLETKTEKSISLL